MSTLVWVSPPVIGAPDAPVFASGTIESACDIILLAGDFTTTHTLTLTLPTTVPVIGSAVRLSVTAGTASSYTNLSYNRVDVQTSSALPLTAMSDFGSLSNGNELVFRYAGGNQWTGLSIGERPTNTRPLSTLPATTPAEHWLCGNATDAQCLEHLARQFDDVRPLEYTCLDTAPAPVLGADACAALRGAVRPPTAADAWRTHVYFTVEELVALLGRDTCDALFACAGKDALHAQPSIIELRTMWSSDTMQPRVSWHVDGANNATVLTVPVNDTFTGGELVYADPVGAHILRAPAVLGMPRRHVTGVLHAVTAVTSGARTVLLLSF